VRVRDGETLTTEGPFAEIDQAVRGYLLFEADDLGAAIELASRIPAARRGGAIEVRPIAEWYERSRPAVPAPRAAAPRKVENRG